jgi:hypothetical protein
VGYDGAKRHHLRSCHRNGERWRIMDFEAPHISPTMTCSIDIADRLVQLANQELQSVKVWIDQLKGPDRTTFLIEVCRVMDLQHVLQNFSKDPRSTLPLQDFDIMVRGWNLALGLLLTRFGGPKGVPLMESTADTRAGATTVLHQLGRSVLLRENAEMIRFGMADGFFDNHRIVIKRSAQLARDHFLDRMEISKLKDLALKEKWPDPMKASIEDSILEDVDSVLEKLVFPWKTTRGVMIGYSAEPEIDNHFLALVAESSVDWRNEAGIHPDVRFGNISGGTLAAIGMLLISFYVKHIRLVEIGKRKIRDANYAMSLTIWKEESELKNSLTEFTGLAQDEVTTALDCFTVRPEDAPYFLQEKTAFIPMRIEISEGYVLAPVSSVFRNPFEGHRKLQEHRLKGLDIAIREPREAWMRSELWHLFLGTRYEIVDRSVVLKRDGNAITDIDAAIFDRTTGELGLFQLKWQDFKTNDIRQQRSKAKNFVDEVDCWAAKTKQWLAEFSSGALAQHLQLKTTRFVSISSIRLFAMGRSASRFQSYGYTQKSEDVAVCNWAQFVRLRYQVGPVQNVLQSLHNRIVAENAYPIEVQRLPHKIIAAGQEILFEDLWNSLPEELTSE